MIQCHDCKKEIKTGYTLVYDDNGEKIRIYKCKPCYKSSPALANYKKTEVYSRVVGYIRPVNQWHTGKKEEFKDRKVYKNP